ncbi:MAG TPA: SpoIIE family protein phosphatase [Solirubrobacteraceae bacterium]|nr:SpoIIE family protein phosphatase [Solirubrobacteraceae bacterium]
MSKTAGPEHTHDPAVVGIRFEDDEPALLISASPRRRARLSAALAGSGLEVELADSVEQGLGRAREREHCVIVLDLQGDGASAAACVARLRRRSSGIPILLVVPHGEDPAQILELCQSGWVDQLTDPCNRELLSSKLALLLELRRGRRALERSESLLRASFELAPIGKTILDGDLCVVRANPAFARLLGVERSRVERVHVSDLCAPEDESSLCDALRAVQRGEPSAAEPGQGGLDVRLRADGREAWAALFASSVSSDELSEPLLLAQWVDLSARRRSEQMRAQLLLEQAAREQAELSARRLRRLQELTDALSNLRLEPMIDELTGRIGELVGAEEVVVRLEDSERDHARGEEALGEQAGEWDARDGKPADGRARGHYREGTGTVVPISFGGRRLASIRVRLPDGRSLGAAERSLLHDAADRAALAIRRAQLHEADHRIAVELQRGLMPKRLPRVRGVELAARYEAAGTGTAVGGDWYDVFTLPAGRVGIVVGDVAGSGIAAASAMGQLRSASRAYALAGRRTRRPGEVIAQLNRYHLSVEAEPRMVTALYAVLSPRTRSLEWANAGHPPPLVIERNGEVRFLEGTDAPIGVEELDYESRVCALSPGACLVLYTDGLVERRGEPLDAGLRRLAATARQAPAEPHAICARLLDKLISDGTERADDLTVVVAKLRASGPPEPKPSV